MLSTRDKNPQKVLLQLTQVLLRPTPNLIMRFLLKGVAIALKVEDLLPDLSSPKLNAKKFKSQRSQFAPSSEESR